MWWKFVMNPGNIAKRRVLISLSELVRKRYCFYCGEYNGCVV